MSEAQAKSLEIELRALRDELAHTRETMANQARAKAAEEALAALYASTSWRITAPLRSISLTGHWFVRGSSAWLTFRPGSRPRRVLRRMTIALASFVLARPRLARPIKQLLRYFPAIERRLRQMRTALALAGSANEPFTRNDHAAKLSDLPPHAREIYSQLKAAMAEKL